MYLNLRDFIFRDLALQDLIDFPNCAHSVSGGGRLRGWSTLEGKTGCSWVTSPPEWLKCSGKREMGSARCAERESTGNTVWKGMIVALFCQKSVWWARLPPQNLIIKYARLNKKTSVDLQSPIDYGAFEFAFIYQNFICKNNFSLLKLKYPVSWK